MGTADCSGSALDAACVAADSTNSCTGNTGQLCVANDGVGTCGEDTAGQCNTDTTQIFGTTADKKGFLTIEETVMGDKGNDECSNRGLCDYGTGLCKCFNGYTDFDCSVQ